MKKLLLSLFLFLFTSIALAATPIISCVPSRTTGVAPLFVFLDCTGTVDSDTTRPFHDLYYEHIFGDSVIATWSNGANTSASKNYANGAVTAHVYEQAGTFKITSRVWDGTTWDTVDNIITVGNPNVVFSGTNTICISSNSLPQAGVDGCPSAAATAQQSSFHTIISSYATTGRRVLLKRGDTFNSTIEARITQTGPGILGSYGTGALPVVNMTFSGNGLGFSASNTPTFKDWRIMDIEINGNNYAGYTSGMGIGETSGGLSQMTILRVTVRNVRTSIGFGLDLIHYYNNYFISNNRAAEAIHNVDQIAIVDCTAIAGSATVYGGYNAGSRYAFMGNNFDNGGNANGSHVTRWPYLNKAVISNNHITRPGFTRLTIKLHGPYWNAVEGVYDPLATYPVLQTNASAYASGDGYSKYIIISGNKFSDAANPWSVEVGPQDIYHDERIVNVIVEKNWWITDWNSQIALRISANEITARNNIFDSSNSTGGQIGVQVVQDGIVAPSNNVRIYNNTFYTSYVVPFGQYSPIQTENTVTNITARNNLAYAPNALGPVMFDNACGACLTQSNNSSNSQVDNTSPLFDGTTTPIGYRPALGSYATNGGTYTFPASYLDFFNCTDKTGVTRIGAVVPKTNARCRGGK